MKIRIKDVSFSYGSTKILDDMSIELGDAEILGLVGPNGSGKTTLIRCIDRILKPEGSIFLDGQEMKAMSGQDIARYIGYVPQSSSSSLSTTVFDTILMGRRPHMGWSVQEEDMEIVVETMQLLDIEEFALKDFGELSGGEKQKVLIARALCQEPRVLLLDEPTSNLDLKHQLEVMEIIRTLVRKKNISAVMVIHDLNLASRCADKIVILKKGMIYAVGDPISLLTSENIGSIYDVEVTVINHDGRPYIIPIRPLDGGTI